MSRLATKITFAALCSLLITACGQQADRDETQQSAAQNSYPEGAARALSIGGDVASEGDDEFDIAVNCATALRITAETVGRMTGSDDTPEIRAIERGADTFESRADAAFPERDVESAIAARTAEKATDSGQQAQLAIACVRRLEEGS